MNQRILLVGNNENNRYLVSLLLQAHGWQVVHAANGPRWLALAAGRDGHIGKPIDPETFVAIVESHLRPGGERAAS